MVTTGASVEWTVVKTEVEALQLEYSWIKEFDPRFNVKYRDDKSYPWLAVTVGEEFPRVMVGPGRQAQGHPLLRPLRPRLGDPRDRRPAAARLPDALVQQRRVQALQPDRPALPARLHRQVRGALRRQRHARRSTARSSTTSATSWPATPPPSSDASSGRCTPPPRRWTSRRPPGSATTSARCSKALEKQAVVLGDGTDADVIALAEDPLEVAVQIFYVRGGRIRGQRGWVADRADDSDTPELVQEFLLQLYGGVAAEDDARRSRARCSCPRCRPTPRVLEDLLSDLRGGAGSPSGCRSAGTRRRCRRRSPATPTSPWCSTRPSAPATSPRATGRWRRSRRPSGSTRCRCASSATTCPTSRAPRSSPRWWSSRTACRARASTAAS